jgi:hypothetical protein
MPIAAMTASGKSSPDGLAYDVKSKVDELITAVNATDTISTSVPVAAVADLGATADLALNPGAHTPTEAIDAVYGDLAAARTSVNALRTNVEIALVQHDNDLDNLATDVEARLDAIEAKVDLILARLRTAAILTA